MSPPPITIRPARPSEREALAALAAGWNQDRRQHSLHAEETAAAVEQGWATWADPFSERVLVATAAGAFVGILSFELHPVSRRAWLHGPFGVAERWPEIARRLLESFESNVAGAVDRVSNFIDVASADAIAAHEDCGYERGPPIHVLVCPRPGASEPASSASPVSAPAEARDQASIASIHDAAFPQSYLTVDEMVRRAASGGHLQVIRAGSDVAAYAFTDLDPSGGEATLHYLAVAPAFRGAGLGTALTEEALRWAFTRPGVERVALTVRGENHAAQAVYRRCGFVTEIVGVPFDKFISSGG